MFGQTKLEQSCRQCKANIKQKDDHAFPYHRLSPCSETFLLTTADQFYIKKIFLNKKKKGIHRFFRRSFHREYMMAPVLTCLTLFGKICC